MALYVLYRAKRIRSSGSVRPWHLRHKTPVRVESPSDPPSLISLSLRFTSAWKRWRES